MSLWHYKGGGFMSTLVLKGYPNERQQEFFMATTRHIAYGGARGGG